MDQKKKMAAAIAAVTAYIESEEEAAVLQTAVAPAEADRKTPLSAGPANLWGLSRRQALMQMGTMMQLKVFHRI